MREERASAGSDGGVFPRLNGTCFGQISSIGTGSGHARMCWTGQPNMYVGGRRQIQNQEYRHRHLGYSLQPSLEF